MKAAVMDLRSAALEPPGDGSIAGNSYQTGMMQAILIGQSFQLTARSVTEDYRSTGTFHALVISGTHVAVLAAMSSSSCCACAFVPESA